MARTSNLASSRVVKPGHQDVLQYGAFFENEVMESCQAERYLGHYVATNVCAKELFHASYVTYHAPLAGLGECSILCGWVQLHARHPPVGFHGIHIACFQQAIIGNTTNVGHLMSHEIEPQGLCLHNINKIVKGFGGGKFTNTSMSSSDKVSTPRSYCLD